MIWPLARTLPAAPHGMPQPTAGFDLTPWRARRVRAWRRRGRAGFVLALLLGLAGAALLQRLALRQQQLDEARRQQLEQRLAALAPGEGDVRRLETWIAAQEAGQARQAALEPRRRRVVALLEALGDAAQDGVALTTVDFATDARGRARVRLAGLADDADAIARWSRRLAAHTGIDAVALDELRLLDAAAPPGATATPGLQLFRVTVRLAAVHETGAR
ncbi:hypothetical protein OVY01_13985 [Robbsia sp. Bb-Pol-6]|uniref:PilN domain-containing protein n=1 Tax=Robbsia betulipollinis TaxID=2981849 RepID=A0ABT3ZPJ4_9BURK|nr:PilN domain-containing protein [Robbsia betulipollinis]MCY0388327.1 hypothetical protein [Robbsia betulipollinis]